MPAKGKGRLQKMGKQIALSLVNVQPFPFLPTTIGLWKYIPYITDEDITYAQNTLNNAGFKRHQLKAIIRYTKKFLQ